MPHPAARFFLIPDEGVVQTSRPGPAFATLLGCQLHSVPIKNTRQWIQALHELTDWITDEGPELARDPDFWQDIAAFVSGMSRHLRAPMAEEGFPRLVALYTYLELERAFVALPLPDPGEVGDGVLRYQDAWQEFRDLHPVADGDLVDHYAGERDAFYLRAACGSRPAALALYLLVEPFNSRHPAAVGRRGALAVYRHHIAGGGEACDLPRQVLTEIRTAGAPQPRPEFLPPQAGPDARARAGAVLAGLAALALVVFGLVAIVTVIA